MQSQRILVFTILSATLGFASETGEAFPRAHGLPDDKVPLEPLSTEQFKNPGVGYRPIDCWWWDGGHLSEEKLKWQLEDLHDKGVGGTWLYPRFGASQPLSAEPGFWTDGWWKFVDYTLTEHERLGMQQWSNDWLGRLTKNYFQDRLRAMRTQHPELTGRRLALHRSGTVANGLLEVSVPTNQIILAASAYRLSPGRKDSYDDQSRIDLLSAVKDHRIRWSPPTDDWIVAVVASEPWGLDYLNPAIANKWIELFFAHYAERVGNHLGKSLTAYGPDERQVLNGDLLYSDEVRARLSSRKGIDLLPNLPALFLDLGPITDKIRCNYHACVVEVLEAAFYAPIQRWLHDHGMKQATIATWGRKNICGQTYNYGDFFRMMRYFDITGNEDSVESGESAFIDTKLSSSIAHLNGHRRVAVCGYWGTGWGFTQEENIARTNVNFALGVNLFNTHGGMYSFMGSRNEFVPPAVHFYQPYWQTWRKFYDYVTRLSYVLSQGEHRAEVAIIYPLSTLHAHWNGNPRENQAFASPARHAERTMFEIGEAIYKRGIDFDFVDEKSVAVATVNGSALCMPQLRFSAVVLPAMTTIPLETARKLREFVAAGGTMIAASPLPTATPENGGNDQALLGIWQDLFGDALNNRVGMVNGSNHKGHAFLVRDQSAAVVPELICKSIARDVRTEAPDLIYTHNQAGNQHIYYFVNQRAEKRAVQLTVKAQGDPEIWDPESGMVRPHHRFETSGDGTRLDLEFNPREGLLVVIQPRRVAPQVIADNLRSIEEVKPQGEMVAVTGTAGLTNALSVKLIYGGRRFEGRLQANSAPREATLENAWECAYHPTMNNRWGDFRYPASNDLIGPEMPVVKYQAETAPTESQDWASPKFDDSKWRKVKCGYGPQWQQLGPFDRALDTLVLRDQIVSATNGVPPSIHLNGKPAKWGTNDYSLKYGSERMDVHQQPADDGLGAPSEDFLVLDRLPDKDSVCYLMTRVYSGEKASTRFHFGKPDHGHLLRQAWLNGEGIVSIGSKDSETSAPVSLRKGWNHIVLRMELPPRVSKAVRTTKGLPPLPPSGNRVQTYAVFDPSAELPPPPRFLPLLRWYQQEPALLYDCGDGKPQRGWFRFVAPPGVRKAKLNMNAKGVDGWINGKKARIQDGLLHFEGTDDEPSEASVVALRVSFNLGSYAGAAFTDPIQFVMGKGLIRDGDWSRQGLEYYSGGLSYNQTLEVNAEQLRNRITLNLGDVRTSAEVLVNGRSVGIRLARPFSFDLSQHLRTGTNRITVKTLNTLANYMSSLPTRYVYEGQTASGMLGPVTLQFSPRVTVLCTPE
jgi:hypothetical protein